MFVKKKCPHFIFQEDRNGEMAISYCSVMEKPEQEHEGNNFKYPCPLGHNPKECYIVESLGSDL